MNRDPRFALSQEMEAKQTLLDQLRALATEDPDFFTDDTSIDSLRVLFAGRINRRNNNPQLSSRNRLQSLTSPPS
jgi:hypothetical protein